MKRLAALLIALIMIPQLAFAESVPEDYVRCYIGGYDLSAGDARACIVDNRTYVPISLLQTSEDIDVAVEDDGTIRILSGEREVDMTLGEKAYRVGEDVCDTDVAPFEKDGEIYLPLRCASTALGKSVYWDQDNRIVVIGHMTDETSFDGDEKIRTMDGYSLTIPAEYKNHFVVEDGRGEINFYDKKNYRRVDHIGHIGAITKVKNPADVDVPMILLTPLPGGYLIFTYDENSGIGEDASAELRQSYENSREEIKDVLRTVRVSEHRS
ncbi:MAG: stalk domain-containing protein [Peptoniphilus sp.]|nr:stalk domain-containing protein [Peptoniphilus sp.]MDD7363192.1 stalk domain-containing protein [Bacillota bacterium]MDY6044484.1 stalk domain-containing protein [Peptoniphilus sp.]